MPPQLKNDPISLISICTCSVITSVFTLLKHESESSAGQKASFTKRETGWGVILKRGRSDMPVTSQCLVSKKLVELHTMSQEFKLYVPIVKHSHTVILPLFNILSLNYRWCQCALSSSGTEIWKGLIGMLNVHHCSKKYILFKEASFILLKMLKNNNIVKYCYSLNC